MAERKKRVVKPLTEEQLLKAEQLAAKKLRDNPDFYDLPESKYSVDNVADFYTKIEEGRKQRILPPEKSRYIIYLRKSTDDEAKQVRSLEDQRVECLMLARRLKIRVREEDIIEEKGSAKTSDNRPAFTKMLDEFKRGTYQGLISWSPDRLSRNMKEAGEIIEMLDLKQIQHLHFITHHFDNTPDGKMMLGILFATSKQYSDKLAVDVVRGITGNAKEGKYGGNIKKGYYGDTKTGYFMPDGTQWQLLRQAVLMRLKDGKTNQEIADFLNEAHFSSRRNEEDDYKIVKMTKQSISKLFTDPFYCGVYKYGENVANLNDLYDFLPLVTPDEFISLGRSISDSFNKEFRGRSTSSQRLDFGLLREKVICDYCGKVMTFQRTIIPKGKNKGKYMLSFYCRNKQECIRHNDSEAIKKYGHKLTKGVRAKYITAGIEWTLRHLTKNTLEAYKQYIGRLEQKLAVDKEVAKRKLKDAQDNLKREQELYNRYRNFQSIDPIEYKKHHKGRLECHKNLVDAHTVSVANMKRELVRLNEALPTEEQFVELVKSYLKTVLKTKDLVEEDAVYKEVVLNLRVGHNAISVINLNPPYDLMVDLDKVAFGGL
ncbi:recombinase family protein [Candidatus Saccharibacteria bacterium]|nr:recombinase family protein [Candidatus Saccharibacteria bacterium]